MTGSFFNSLDYFYIFLILASCLIGFFRGFIKDFFSTCSWLGSGFASAFVSPYFAHYLQENDMIHNSTYAKVVAVVLSFTVILISLQLVINLVSKTVKSTTLSGVDRAFGTLYGFVRGFVILIIICICAIVFNMVDMKREFIADSKITPMLINVTDYLLPKMMSIPKIGLKYIPSQIGRDRFSKENVRETERLSRGKIRKSEKDEHKSAKSERGKESGNYLTDLVSKFWDREDTQTDISQTQRLKKHPKIKNKEDNVQFGCMDLMKARAQRKAQKKAERIREDLMKSLDNNP